ncbi:MAG: lysophospholipid acyltransferase family protein [Elusimicrobiaceae bacterium]|nr:lysophospholipid acyltransferase family protein [Elusimicrobiaceae bacterium]
MSSSSSTTPAGKVTWLHRAAGWAGYFFLLCTGRTSRISWIKDPAVEELERRGKNYIFAIWHCKQAFLIYTHRRRRICALVSMSKDGEYIARVLMRAGLSAVRGSTSRGGTKALLGLLGKIGEGFCPVITPDGPRGPRRTVQQGVIFLARKTGLPIVPLACGNSRKMVFNSWDRFELPLPFSRAAVVEGAPITVGEDETAESAAARIKLALDRATDKADRLAAQ